MKIAVPDIVSNSYFPAIAAADLGLCDNLTVEPIFPVPRAYAALRDGTVDFVATSAHGALSAFPDFRGVKLICAQSQGLYWFLVMRADLDPARGDLSIVEGRTIGAAPWADDGLKGVLRAAGIDPASATIRQPTLALPPGGSFGIAMVQALRDKTIDGFWANGMAAELAVRSGAGVIVLDARRDGSPAYTQPTIATTERLLADAPDRAAAVVRGIVAAHAALRADPGLATCIAAARFPAAEAALIETLIIRDLPFYDAEISPAFISGMLAFASSLGQLNTTPVYSDVVATQLSVHRRTSRGPASNE